MADLKEEEKAIERAITLLHEAEDQTDYHQRDSLRALASVYVSLGKELRLGKSKTKVYGALRVDKPAPPPAQVHSFPEEDEEVPVDGGGGATELPPQ